MTIDSLRLRFADDLTAGRYPGDVVGPAPWLAAGDGVAIEAEIALGALAAGTIVAPSVSLLDLWPYDFSFELVSTAGRWALPPVPSRAGERAPEGAGGAVRSVIDCWHLNADLEDVRVVCRVTAPGAPARYLLTVSVRPVHLADLPEPPAGEHLTAAPPRFSQMLENPRIAGRICSPVSLAMVLAMPPAAVPLHEVVPLCLDAATGMYGLWPLAVRAASRFGRLGAVELLEDWSLVTASLDAGVPVVASIRYGAGGLPGAPQNATGGHLVVVHGVHGGMVAVNDPAAPDRGSVLRRYPVARFAEAWFRHRGAAYILLP